MATYFLSPISTVLQAFTNGGVILAGGSITTYLAGTTTLTDTWTDITGAVKNSNPITLDSAGRPPSMIWQQSRVPIKAIFKDASAVQIGPTYDQLSGIGDPGTSLTTFFGTDAGAANAYVITVPNANFSSYSNGLVIYWSPANSNTTSSTVNVNGLGAVALTYGDGTALASGALVAGSIVQMISQGGSFVLISSGGATYSSGTFTPSSWTGFSVSPIGNVLYTKIGNLVTLQFASNCTGTSNTTGLAFAGLPVALRPTTAGYPYVPIFVTDSGALALGGMGFGVAAGVVTFYKGSAPPSDTGFTNSGTKGFNTGVTVTYKL